MQNHSILKLIENWFFPPKCVVTDKPTQKFDLADSLINQWKLPKSLCPSCLQVEISNKLCGKCLQLKTPLNYKVLFRYNSDLSLLIQNLKYNDQLYLSRLFAELWEAEFSREQVDAIIPIPLHLKRYKERGFNQAELLARFISKLNLIPVFNALERVKTTPTQTGLKLKERRANLKGAFLIKPQANSHLKKMKKVAVLDDVITTGATTQSAIKEIKKHHPHLEIDIWGIAKTLKQLR